MYAEKTRTLDKSSGVGSHLVKPLTHLQMCTMVYVVYIMLGGLD
jgi:hypothetical protein